MSSPTKMVNSIIVRSSYVYVYNLVFLLSDLWNYSCICMYCDRLPHAWNTKVGTSAKKAATKSWNFRVFWNTNAEMSAKKALPGMQSGWCSLLPAALRMETWCQQKSYHSASRSCMLLPEFHHCHRYDLSRFPRGNIFTIPVFWYIPHISIRVGPHFDIPQHRSRPLARAKGKLASLQSVWMGTM